MEGLPKLPGLDFENRLKQNHTVSHCFNYTNGYRMPRKPPIGIGGDPLKEDSIEFVKQDDSVLYDPALTYGRVKHPPVEPFRPRYVVYDQVVLTFHGFFKQSVPESAKEHYRIRYVKVLYFMEDDSMTVLEPAVVNCGFPQGRLVRRGKIAKNNMELYTWKDLNVGIDIELNGTVYHLTDCDEFTKEFMAAQGIELNETECQPVDPYTTTKIIVNLAPHHKTPSDDDKLRRFLEFSGKVLTFNAVLDETDRPYGECMTYKVFYFLEDDTVAVKELPENQEGRDHFPMLLKRTKLPRNWKQRPRNFPGCYLETTVNEVNEYYQPKHMRVGDTVFVYGRRLLLLDCDAFTRKYFEDVLHEPQKNGLGIEFPAVIIPKREIPEYLGLGTPEDSLQSCFGLMPKPPKKDVITYVLNANKFLRYGATLDNTHPEDQIREFIIYISLADGKIKIMEPPIRNSGIKGGMFLSARLVMRPGCDRNMPEYYEPKDFWIGKIVTIYSHRFRIVSADLYVYRYMQEHPEMFEPEAVDGVRNYLLLNGKLREDLKCAAENDCLEAKQDKVASDAGPAASNMDLCLQEITKRNQETLHPDFEDDYFTDNARKPGNIDPGECRYYIDDEREDRVKYNDEILRQQAIKDLDPKMYASSQCNDMKNCKKSVKFSDDECAKKCRHQIQTGHCLTCCP